MPGPFLLLMFVLMKKAKNKVFIATSLDGFISDRKGEIDWLHSIPNPEQNDMGYAEFISQIDAILMGRNTFETICSFGIEWPYSKPVFVLSKSLDSLPEEYSDKASLVKGSLSMILASIHEKGYYQLYIDGGKTIQYFLQEDLIDEMTISIIPVLLGGGIHLFGKLSHKIEFECKRSRLFLDQIVQNHYIRKA